MQDMFLRLYVRAKTIAEDLQDESGQDLIEYALVVALIALAATVGMSTIANDINNAFVNVGTRLSTYTAP